MHVFLMFTIVRTSNIMTSKQRKRKIAQIGVVQGFYCFWCGKPLTTDKLTLDHLIPRSRGGSNCLENFRLACFPSNNSRGNSFFPPGWQRI